MAKKGTALMMVGADVPAELEDEFNKWYQEEHLQELLGVPGILNAARYEATKSGPKHLAVYELESVDVINSDAFKNRPRTEWGQKVSPSIIGTNNINLVLDMIHPIALTDSIANSDMANALQIGRMDVAPSDDAEWNKWYSEVYVPNYEKCPGVIRGRRWRAVRGTPQYATVYEFEDENVSETEEWLKQRDIHPDNPRMRDIMTHAPGSPGIWKKTFQL
ncbi:MAG TPA: hypothetical protein DCE26_07140 [Dehalococcoidia bacterium]|nr:hypothetical protein [Chloroflexota bacterium]HAA95448.1 hypothetical protein [Dehalococcoidia bacterium]|tara:strand:+ start:6760 stop:7416 length:657 start_codon:yes stop_codon:yes gene_type:complete